MACCPTQAIICDMLMKEPGDGQEYSFTEIKLMDVRADLWDQMGTQSSTAPYPERVHSVGTVGQNGNNAGQSCR